mmetsp:Transcript_22816/g.32200  ORF Transcript_22816/g.32200 Transcript_22816/m.32200 type:complete len:379 (+) Transcript_22816:791-1927(+)
MASLPLVLLGLFVQGLGFLGGLGGSFGTLSFEELFGLFGSLRGFFSVLFSSQVGLDRGSFVLLHVFLHLFGGLGAQRSSFLLCLLGCLLDLVVPRDVLFVVVFFVLVLVFQSMVDRRQFVSFLLQGFGGLFGLLGTRLFGFVHGFLSFGFGSRCFCVGRRDGVLDLLGFFVYLLFQCLSFLDLFLHLFQDVLSFGFCLGMCVMSRSFRVVCDLVGVVCDLVGVVFNLVSSGFNMVCDLMCVVLDLVGSSFGVVGQLMCVVSNFVGVVLGSRSMVGDSVLQFFLGLGNSFLGFVDRLVVGFGGVGMCSYFFDRFEMSFGRFVRLLGSLDCFVGCFVNFVGGFVCSLVSVMVNSCVGVVVNGSRFVPSRNFEELSYGQGR